MSEEEGGSVASRSELGWVRFVFHPFFLYVSYTPLLSELVSFFSNIYPPPPHPPLLSLVSPLVSTLHDFVFSPTFFFFGSLSRFLVVVFKGSFTLLILA